MSDTDKLSRYFSRRVNLLIVEDSESLLLALKGIFSIPCFNVTGVSTLETAKEVIARGARYGTAGLSICALLETKTQAQRSLKTTVISLV